MSPLFILFKQSSYRALGIPSDESLRVTIFCTSCANADHQHDALGRTPLHMAASYGRYDLVRWLIKDRKLDVNARDDESGWTPLHRCLFYGHLDVAALLVKLGADLFAEDREGLTPLDMVLIDRKQTFPSLHLSPPAHVFTWGLNDNFTLGHAESNCRLPGRVKFITASQAAKTISIKQIVMCQFHSVFLSHDGRVFTCGHGQGGRLGIADEETTLRASEISSITGIKIAQIAAARDHTVLLTDKGAVYTFGMNNYHQLGQVPSPKRCLKPKQISSKHLHNKVMIGIAAGTYHTVMHTNEELYTCGTNYGQIGHAAMERQVTLPKLVSSLSLESSTELVKRKIQIVATSEYATACTTDVGEIYIMSDFNIRKIRIPRGQQSIERLRLKSFAIPSNNSNSNEHRIMLFVICKPNFQLLSWTNEYRKLYICKWAQKPDMHIMDIAFTEDNKVLISAGNIFLFKF
ncbi:uncharacterized protein TRIADDRAFT_57002 [Trichoplax adhaerens]|uniref:Uncharacterized protein n=1 Tax=Trichoplax adhaerens TaxID=10228 RepID=B3RX55_TRIAD|nr:hypothetical protein TRIADDRAFT_57002 [Trichoplax adhaerens]EDV25247.1 hypothetical protein TRIADDRAFT_57002 [Trichoplax adhaerens]|eukprot:XP_002113137.1 hypothetical protein TRIADDRAFT_57002 [Trichoplax adhaerens]